MSKSETFWTQIIFYSDLYLRNWKYLSTSWMRKGWRINDWNGIGIIFLKLRNMSGFKSHPSINDLNSTTSVNFLSQISNFLQRVWRHSKGIIRYIVLLVKKIKAIEWKYAKNKSIQYRFRDYRRSSVGCRQPQSCFDIRSGFDLWLMEKETSLQPTSLSSPTPST